MFWEGETTVLTADHSEIPVSQVIIAHRNTGGQVEWVSTIIRDISERKQAEMERLELALQRERVEFFREFLGNISHDLRTPLSVIRANLYLIEQFTDPQRQRDKLQTIKTQTILLEKYLQDILTISRLEHAPKLELKSLDVNDLIKSIHNQLQSKAEEKHLVTQLDLAPDVDLVQGDKDELQRAIVNLVENALRYTPGNGCVTIRTYKGENNAVVEISDTGIGISPEDLPHIFDRFYRATPARSMERGGTGLGLAIVKKVVDMHNGVIEVKSVPQMGSTFRVTLPLNRDLFAQ